MSIMKKLYIATAFSLSRRLDSDFNPTSLNVVVNFVTMFRIIVVLLHCTLKTKLLSLLCDAIMLHDICIGSNYYIVAKNTHM